MFDRLLKVSAVLIFTITLLISGAYAGGKMEVRLDEKVTLIAEKAGANTTYKWVVKQGGDIVSTQVGTVFNHTFEVQGAYSVNLIATDEDETIKSTMITLLAGDRFTRFEQRDKVAETKGEAFTLTTLPPAKNGRIELAGEGTVLFNVDGLSPDILEVRIDRNIFADSNNNGIANDDIDNSSHESYLRGGSYSTDYTSGDGTKVVAEVTVVARDGQKTKKQVEIVFGDAPGKTGEPVAILDTTPPIDSASKILYLYEGQRTVGFYAKRSGGNLIEYRIDRNIFVDSDGDGDPANDIDNQNHPSFKTGDVWEATYEKTDQQIIAQLIVVSADGKGSRVQRELRFSDKPKAADDAGDINLIADKNFALTGDPIHFTVEGLLLSLDQYTFGWDFESDGVIDKEVEGENTLQHIFETPGVFDVTVTITDKQGNSGDRSLEIISREGDKTEANFEFTVEGNKVVFSNKSTVNLSLASKKLTHEWSFGDISEANYKEQKGQIRQENPTYTYIKSGTYSVILTVTDTDKVTSTVTKEVFIEGDLATEKPEETVSETPTESKPKKEGGIVITVLKILFYIILIVVALILLIVGGFLIVLKMQHPDLTLEELIDEMKSKVLSMIGVHDEHEMRSHEPPPTEAPEEPEPTPQPPQPSQEPAPAAEVPSEPETVAGKEIIEGEIEDPLKPSDEPPLPEPPGAPEPSTPRTPKPESDPTSPETPSAPQTPPISPITDESVHPAGDQSLGQQDGPVPDWLKNQ